MRGLISPLRAIYAATQTRRSTGAGVRVAFEGVHVNRINIIWTYQNQRIHGRIRRTGLINKSVMHNA